VSIAHKITWSLQAQGVNVLSGSQVEAGDLQPMADVAVPAATTDQPATLAIVAAKLQVLFLVSDKDLTLKTNSPSAPANTFSLKAGAPLVWSKSEGYFANPLSADVTAIYLTNAGTAAARFQLYALSTI
jgi:hypothetical protein